MSLPNRLNALLLDCLGHLPPHQWPGGDGFTQEDVLHEYPALAAKRLVSGEDTLYRLHPELAAELAEFFAARTAQQGAEAERGMEAESGMQTFVRPERAEG
jgi:hypothetical protein